MIKFKNPFKRPTAPPVTPIKQEPIKTVWPKNAKELNIIVTRTPTPNFDVFHDMVRPTDMFTRDIQYTTNRYVASIVVTQADFKMADLVESLNWITPIDLSHINLHWPNNIDKLVMRYKQTPKGVHSIIYWRRLNGNCKQIQSLIPEITFEKSINDLCWLTGSLFDTSMDIKESI